MPIVAMLAMSKFLLTLDSSSFPHLYRGCFICTLGLSVLLRPSRSLGADGTSELQSVFIALHWKIHLFPVSSIISHNNGSSLHKTSWCFSLLCSRQSVRESCPPMPDLPSSSTLSGQLEQVGTRLAITKCPHLWSGIKPSLFAHLRCRFGVLQINIAVREIA